MKNRLLLAALTALLAPAAVAQDKPAPRMRLGINDNWVNYWQNSGRFNDVLMGSNWNVPGRTDPLVGQAIAATEGYARPGVYTLTATGKGTVYCGLGQANTLPAAPDVLPANQQATFTGTESYRVGIAQSKRTLVQVRASDDKTPLTGVRLLAPGAGPGLYHPGFLASISGFDTIRFMDSQETSGSKEANWADRRKDYGADVESLIELCNLTGSNGWFCLPARCVGPRGAPTDYPEQLGKLLNARLKPGLSVYVEYSNEVWNWGQPWIDETNYVYSSAGQEYGDYLSGHGQYARLAHAAMNALESQVGPNGPKIKRVLARQLADAAGAADALAAAKARGWRFDALAGGMYWDTLGLDVAAVKTAYAAGNKATAFGLIDAAFRTGLARTITWVKAYKALADQYGLELVAYEGGPTGTALWYDKGTGPTIMWDYVRSPWCQQMMVDALTAHAAAGVSLFNLYSHCHTNGIWSLRGKHIDDLCDRRYRGARAYQVGSSPAVYLGADTATQGAWIGTYGTLGAVVAGGPAPAQPTPPPPGPAIAAVTPVPTPAGKLYMQAAPGATTDPRTLQVPDGSARVAAWWYAPTRVDLDFPAPADGSLRVLSLYFLEWDSHWGETLSVQLADAATGTVLDTRTVAGKDFNGGVYLRWTIDGHVRVAVTKTGAAGGMQNGNAKVSGIFLDPVPSP